MSKVKNVIYDMIDQLDVEIAQAIKLLDDAENNPNSQVRYAQVIAKLNSEKSALKRLLKKLAE